jgi:hypothetical protein
VGVTCANALERERLVKRNGSTNLFILVSIYRVSANRSLQWFQSLWCKITKKNAREGNKSVHEMVKNVHIGRYLQTKAEEGSGKPSSASI